MCCDFRQVYEVVEQEDFWGRQDEFEVLKQTLRSQDTSVVVTGVEGVGKSTLLRAFAQQNGVPLVDVQGAFDKLEVITQIAIQVIEDPEVIVFSRLVDVLISSGQTLLVLDGLDEAQNPWECVRELIGQGIQVVLSARKWPEHTTMKTLHLGPLDLGADLTLHGSRHVHPGVWRHKDALDGVQGHEGMCDVTLFRKLLDQHLENLSASSHALLDKLAWSEGSFNVEMVKRVWPEEKEALDELITSRMLEHTPVSGRLIVPRSIREAVWRSGSEPNAHLLTAMVPLLEGEDVDMHARMHEHLFLRTGIDWGVKHDIEMAIRAAVVLAKLRFYLGPYDVMMEVLERLHHDVIRHDVQDVHVLALSLELGKVYKALGRPQDATRILTASLRSSQTPDEERVLAEIHVSLSSTYRLQFELEKSIEHAQKAYEIYQKLGLATQNDVGMALAISYSLNGQFMEAIDLLKEAQLREPQRVAVHANLSVVYSFTGDASRTDMHLDCALRFAEQQGIKRLTPLFIGKARVSTWLQNFEEAEQWLFKAQTLSKDLQHHLSVPYLHSGWGLYHTCLKSLRLALNSYDQVLRQIHILPMIKPFILCMQSGLFSFLQDFAKAARWITLAESLESRAPTDKYNILYAQAALTLAKDGETLSRPEKLALVQGWLPEDETKRSLTFKILARNLHSRFITIPDVPTLQINSGKTCLCINGGEWIDLRRRHVMQRFCATLIEHHSSNPGEPLPFESLFKAVWKGEELRGSTKNRFHTAIHRLREQVLGELLVTVENGYLLHAETQIEEVQEKM